MSSTGNPTNNNDGSGTGGSSSSPSPGKGGKFLELMQKRIMAEQQQQQQPAPSTGNTISTTVDPIPQVNHPSQPYPLPAMDGAIMQQQQLQQPPAATAPAGSLDFSAMKQQPTARPKGKDFASMSSRGPPQPAQIQQQQQPQQTLSSAPPAGKPKGKDFSAMASRMSVPIPAPAPIPLHSQPNMQNPSSSDQVSQVARAAQMQAEARAAAGLPPLSKPTATTVTSTMSGIPSQRPNMPNQQQQQYPGMAGTQQHHSQQHHPSQQQYSQSRPSSQGYSSSGHQQSQQQHSQQSHFSNHSNPMYGTGISSVQDPMSRIPSSSSNNSATSSNMQRATRPASVAVTSPPSSSNYRTSKTATINTSTTSKLREPTGRTPQPSSIEAKVTMQASAAISSTVLPYMAPLVGQRIQDLVASLDPSYTIDSQAQEQLLQLADDFLDKVCKQSLRLATHRGSAIMEVQDVQLVLAKQWGIVIPGLGPPILNKSRVAPLSTSSTHSATSTKQTSGAKRKSSGSHKSSTATSTTKSAQQSQSNKISKQNEANP